MVGELARTAVCELDVGLSCRQNQPPSVMARSTPGAELLATTASR